jgi:hypothetical protein
MRFVIAVGVALSAVLGITICGCGKSTPINGPKTIPVRGKVIFTRGGTIKSLADKQARIELESVDQPGVRAAGTIQEDGAFEVATVTSEGGSNGAVPGAHRVRIDLDDSAQKLLAPQFLDFGKSGITITLPSDQPVEVRIWR